MKRYGHSFLASLLPVIVVACNADPGISGNSAPGIGNGGGAGSSQTGGSGKGGATGSAGTGPSVGMFDPDKASMMVKGGAGGGESEPPAEGKPCALEKFELERNPAELLLVLDRSGSMTQKDPPRTTTRWEETTAALNETLKATENLVSWGLKMFPTTSQCTVTPGVEEDVKPANYMTVYGRVIGAPPMGGNTPTTAAMNAAVTYLKTRTTKNPKFIVLATDGDPNCLGAGGGQDRAGAIAAVGAAAAAGFKTYVIGIATAGSAATVTLDMMADAGKAPRMGTPRYYPVTTRQELVATLSMIAGQISSCVFPFSKPPPSTNAAVKIDGMIVTKDPTDGWSYGAGDQSIQLNGTSCERLKSAQKADVSITFQCPGVIID